MINNNHSSTINVLASLRAMASQRGLSTNERFMLAERQATRLLDLTGYGRCPVPSAIVRELPHIRLEYRIIPASGLSFWDGNSWVICLNRNEPTTRQRFTLLHEFKHIIDHISPQARPQGGANPLAERLADYFAGCVLVPESLLTQAWFAGTQQPADLGTLFQVSAQAIRVRLGQVGLVNRASGCLTSSSIGDHPAHYFRQRASSQFIPDLALEASHVPGS
jgi:hypothetical protein